MSSYPPVGSVPRKPRSCSVVALLGAGSFGTLIALTTLVVTKSV
jgi:hypothetical protein